MPFTSLCPEIFAPYVDGSDRFVVSLVFSVPEERAQVPVDALEIVRDYARRDVSAALVWCVFDRTTGQRTTYMDADAADSVDPTGDEWPSHSKDEEVA